MREITATEAFKWTSTRTIVKEEEEADDTTVITINDGSILKVASADGSGTAETGSWYYPPTWTLITDY